jgi:hypothetical protein
MTMARSRLGKLRTTSITRMITLSVRPPAYPAIAPSTAPMTIAKPTVTNPT